MKDWTKNLQKLKAFKKSYGHTHVPSNWREDPILARWVANIRKSPQRFPGALVLALRRLNFDFGTDRSWQGMYGQLADFWKTHGHTFIPDDTRYEALHTWVQQQRDAQHYLGGAQKKLLDDLGFDWRPVSRAKNNWEFQLAALKKFKEKFGHTKVTMNYEDKSLGTWVSNIRVRSHRLDASQKKRLDALGFLWKEDVEKMVKDQWMKRLAELKAFKKRFGHCNVPIKWKENKQLSVWVSEQRLRHKGGRLLPERAALLNSIGFSWSQDLLDQFDQHWRHMFGRLKAYKKKYGSLRIFAKRDRELKLWYMAQRIMKKKNMLPLARQKALESVGAIWGSVRENNWEVMYNRLKQYKAKHGVISTISRKTDGALGVWVVQQRQLKAKRKLSDERVRKLEKTGLAWAKELRNNVWTERYDQLIAFKRKFGHVRVPRDVDKYEVLRRWVDKQRNSHAQGKLSPSRYAQLKKLGLELRNIRELQWQNRLAALALFKKKYGHIKVSEATHPSLYRWILKVRQKHRAGKLPHTEVKKLKALGLTLKPRRTRSK